MNARLFKPGQDQPEAKKLIPLLGKITNGATVPTKTGKVRPTSLDFWTVGGVGREQKENPYRAMFHKVIGNSDTIIIAFYTDDHFHNCRLNYTLQSFDGSRWAYGDGRTFKVWNGENGFNGKMVEVEIEAHDQNRWMHNEVQRAKEFAASKGKEAFTPVWKRTLRMQFYLPQLKNYCWGSWVYETTSEVACDTLPGVYDGIVAEAGRAKGICFELQTRQHKSHTPGANKYPVVSLVPLIDKDRAQRIRENQALYEHKELVLLDNTSVDGIYQNTLQLAPPPIDISKDQGEIDYNSISKVDLISHLQNCETQVEIDEIVKAATKYAGDEKFNEFVNGLKTMV